MGGIPDPVWGEVGVVSFGGLTGRCGSRLVGGILPF